MTIAVVTVVVVTFYSKNNLTPPKLMRFLRAAFRDLAIFLNVPQVKGEMQLDTMYRTCSVADHPAIEPVQLIVMVHQDDCILLAQGGQHLPACVRDDGRKRRMVGPQAHSGRSGSNCYLWLTVVGQGQIVTSGSQW